MYPFNEPIFFGTTLAEISADYVDGASLFHRIGYSTLISSVEERTIWASPVALYSPPTANSTLSLVSTSASDMCVIEIDGLQKVGSTYQPIIERIQLNGITPVTTANQFFRVQSTRVFQANSLLGNVGTITTSHSGVVLSTIPINRGVSMDAVGYLPPKTWFFLLGLVVTTFETDKRIRISMRSAPFGETLKLDSQYDAVNQRDYIPIHRTFSPGTDVMFTAQATTGSNLAVTIDPIGVVFDKDKVKAFADKRGFSSRSSNRSI